MLSDMYECFLNGNASKNECFLTTGCQDIDFKKTLTQCDGNRKAYNRGNYNSSFALRAVELKTDGA